MVIEDERRGVDVDAMSWIIAVIVVLVVLVVLAIVVVVSRRRRRSGGVIATPLKSERTGESR